MERRSERELKTENNCEQSRGKAASTTDVNKMADYSLVLQSKVQYDRSYRQTRVLQLLCQQFVEQRCRRERGRHLITRIKNAPQSMG